MFIGGEMIWCSTGKGEPFNLAGPRYDLRPVAYVHRFRLTFDADCDVFAFTGEGHDSDKAPRKLAMRTMGHSETEFSSASKFATD